MMWLPFAPRAIAVFPHLQTPGPGNRSHQAKAIAKKIVKKRIDRKFPVHPQGSESCKDQRYDDLKKDFYKDI